MFNIKKEDCEEMELRFELILSLWLLLLLILYDFLKKNIITFDETSDML